MDAVKVIGAPNTKRSERKRVGDIAPDDQMKIGEPQNAEDIRQPRARAWRNATTFRLAAIRLAKRQKRQGQQQPRQPGPKEGATPAEMGRHLAAEHVPKRRADRDGDVKNRERIVPPGRTERIGDHTGADRRIAGLAHPDQDPETKQHRET